MQKIREHVVRQGSSTMDNKTLQNQVMKDLKVLVHSETPILFSQVLSAFLSKCSEFTSFIQYFKRNYLDNNWYKHWCRAFQSNYDTNMETNNYVESWHNQLKTIYLKR
ncbi:MAG: hypothetical protein EXX96DRAFT_560786 [Benjaminiella poitrasii]|nr:MAG: hypothetical protein EXX96DRAFT_560786 [Benjaminiella poitrasii]